MQVLEVNRRIYIPRSLCRWVVDDCFLIRSLPNPEYRYIFKQLGSEWHAEKLGVSFGSKLFDPFTMILPKLEGVCENKTGSWTNITHLHDLHGNERVKLLRGLKCRVCDYDVLHMFYLRRSIFDMTYMYIRWHGPWIQGVYYKYYF